jgi:hypothetical protein
LKGSMPVRTVSQYRKSDWHLSFLLGLLLVVVFVLYPMGDHGPWAGVLLQTVFSVLLISGVPLVAGRRKVRALATLFAVGTAIIGWLRFDVMSGRLIMLGVSLWVVFFAVLAVMILVRVFGKGRINIHRIQGAVAIYLLLGVIWSGCYRLVLYFHPEAFSPLADSNERTLMSKLVYFSFATLTTVGYGDITAVHPAARSLAMLEALTGQLFPAVLIARLVSMEVSHTKGQ